MTLFPDVIGEQLAMRPFFHTVQVRKGETSFQRYRKFIRPRPYFDLAFEFLQESDALALETQILSTAGAAGTFDWFHWTQFHWIWVPLGVGNGAQTVFTIPGKATTDQQFFTGASTSVAGVVAFGTGPQGEDVVTLSVAPASGLPVWANFSGRRRFTVSFERDDQPVTRLLDPDGFYSLRTTLVGVR
jgi:hypothetical protein